MKKSRLSIEITLYALALAAALLVRLVGLGQNALTSYEAGWALDAYHLANGQPVLSSAQPGYTALTGLIFGVFGSSDFGARLIPALAGSLLVLAPVFFRHRLGRLPALILAFFLALDPGLAAVSRQAGGAMLALSALVLGLGAWLNQRRLLAGAFAALALLGGPSFWHGLLAIAIGWGLAALLKPTGLISAGVDDDDDRPPAARRDWVLAGLALAGTILAAGTLFFRYPQGLGGIGTALAGYLTSWGSSAGIPALRLPFALLIYQPLGLVFGLAEMVRAWVYRRPEDAASQKLSLWFAAALFLAFILPGRQVDDLAWALVPLLGLAAPLMVRLFLPRLRGQNLAAAAGMAGIVFIVLLFSWNFIIGPTAAGGQGGVGFTVVYLLVGMIIMIALAVAMISFGWSLRTGLTGLSWGLLAVFTLFWISTLWGTMGLSANPRREMWGQGPYAGQVALLTATLNDLSKWSTGMNISMETVVLADSPALRWALRDWPAVKFAGVLDSTALPPAIIAYSGQEPPALAASYAGQDFVIEGSPMWTGVLPSDFVKWLAFRSTVTVDSVVILWARADLFPGGINSASTPP